MRAKRSSSTVAASTRTKDYANPFSVAALLPSAATAHTVLYLSADPRYALWCFDHPLASVSPTSDWTLTYATAGVKHPSVVSILYPTAALTFTLGVSAPDRPISVATNYPNTTGRDTSGRPLYAGPRTHILAGTM